MTIADRIPVDRGNTSTGSLRIQIVHHANCPLVAELRSHLDHAMARCDIRVEIEEVEGNYSSPTLLINGTDITGRSVQSGLACRLDLPSEGQIVKALLNGAHNERT